MIKNSTIEWFVFGFGGWTLIWLYLTKVTNDILFNNMDVVTSVLLNGIFIWLLGFLLFTLAVIIWWILTLLGIAKD